MKLVVIGGLTVNLERCRLVPRVLQDHLVTFGDGQHGTFIRRLLRDKLGLIRNFQGDSTVLVRRILIMMHRGRLAIS